MFVVRDMPGIFLLGHLILFSTVYCLFDHSIPGLFPRQLLNLMQLGIKKQDWEESQ